MPQFEVFRKRSNQPGGVNPQVTLQRGGTFSLNQKSFDALGQPEAVVLLYDTQQRIIGFRKVEPGDFNAFPVHRQGKGQSYLVNGLSFCQFYEIPLGQARRYKAQLFDDVLGIDLNGESAEVTSNRNRKREQQATATR